MSDGDGASKMEFFGKVAKENYFQEKLNFRCVTGF